MGSKVGIYPGGPAPSLSPHQLGPVRAKTFPTLGTLQRRQQAVSTRLVVRVEQARRLRQCLWVVLAVALAVFAGLRLAASAPAAVLGNSQALPAANTSGIR